MANKPLTGVTVLVTRPAHQAQALCQLIEAQGGKTRLFPSIDIEAVADNPQLDAVLKQLPDYDIAIFTSANAVNFALQRIPKWPQPGPQIAAVGKASAKALTAQGLKVDLQPESSFNSEALLALPALNQVAQKRVVIFRGVGGRELLAEQLSRRGAEIDYAECYQRCLPKPEPAQLQAIKRALSQGEIDALTATSNESLLNLHQLLCEDSGTCLNQTTIIGVSQRLLELTNNLQLQQPRIAAQASDQAIVDELIAWHRERSDKI